MVSQKYIQSAFYS